MKNDKTLQDYDKKVDEMLRNRRYERGDMRTDEEVEEHANHLLYYTGEEAEQAIKELEEGPETYTEEKDATKPVIVTRGELIERIRKRTRV